MLTESDLKVGHVYAAKKPRKSKSGYYNDRRITYVDTFSVMYDTRERRDICAFIDQQFLPWADRDVTAETPEGEWRKWKGK